MAQGRIPQPSREKDIDPIYKLIDDAAARLTRAILLLGVGLAGLAAAMLWLHRTFGVYRAALGWTGWLDLAFHIVMLLLLLAAIVGSIIWGLIVLGGSINALLLARQHVQAGDGQQLPWLIRRIFVGRTSVLALVLPALGLSLCMVVPLALWAISNPDLLRYFIEQLTGSAP